MIQLINKKESEVVFNTIRQSIKVLAGVKFNTNEPFLYSNGTHTIACTVEDTVITLVTRND